MAVNSKALMTIPAVGAASLLAFAAQKVVSLVSAGNEETLLEWYTPDDAVGTYAFEIGIIAAAASGACALLVWLLRMHRANREWEGSCERDEGGRGESRAGDRAARGPRRDGE